MLAERARRKLLLVVLVGASGLAAFAFVRFGPEKTRRIPGMVRQTEIRMAPEITGRLASIAVRQSQHVKQGELVASIDNPDLIAATAEASAALASAGAERARIYSGTRLERLAISAEAVRTAEANLLLANQQNDRAVILNSKSVLSQQQLDQSRASLAKAEADLDGKRAQYTAAQAGPTEEERRLVSSKVALAAATVTSLEAQSAKTSLIAPVDGTIGIRVAEPGEIMAPGKPIVTLNPDGRCWFAFTVREDMLKGLSIGGHVALRGANEQRIETRVSELRPLGEFAVWRAARAVGDHDLNSFRVRFDPLIDACQLHPGMTVWLDR